MDLKLPLIYPITDTRISGLSHSEQVRRFVDGGAKLIQLREKHLPAYEFFIDAQEAVDIAHSSGVRIIINDRVDIAMALGADGVHLGQTDLPPADARKLIGKDKIIGYSTHSIEQADAAAALPVDYIAVGPIFPTTSKADADPVLGTTGLAIVRSAIGECQLVAIGGIGSASANEVLKCGADSVAMITELLREPAKISEIFRNLSISVQNGVKHR